MKDTIYALSSGAPPSAIAVVRVSGPAAHEALRYLTGGLPEARRAVLARLAAADGELDRALVLRFDGPATATGEDLVELHLHGGRAVVAAVSGALAAMPGLREAEPGEFTRRALANGRIDLTEAEGLGDLLAAETESQRKAAAQAAGGALSRFVDDVRDTLLGLAAAVEAQLDFSDEGDVDMGLSPAWHRDIATLRAHVVGLLDEPPVDRLRDGIRVVIAGPPNAGKSTLLNAIVAREVAIVSPIAGTTRDVIEAPVALGGLPFLFVDTAGLRESSDEIETIGVARAVDAMALADILLWLGAAEECPSGAVLVHAKADILGDGERAALHVSALTGEGIGDLKRLLIDRARPLVPAGNVTLNQRQRDCLADVDAALNAAMVEADLLLVAEELRSARHSLDRLTGRAGVDDMLDQLFGRFCIGK